MNKTARVFLWVSWVIVCLTIFLFFIVLVIPIIKMALYQWRQLSGR